MAKLSKKTFPEGTQFDNWRITEQDDVLFVVRNVTLPDGTRTSDRMELGFYKTYRNDRKRLQAYVDRRNFRDVEAEEAKERKALRDAFIEPSLLDGFEDRIKLEIPTAKRQRMVWSIFNRYFLNFFVLKLSRPDPKTWEEVDLQVKWGAALLNRSTVAEKHRLYDKQSYIPSKAHIERVVQIANRFMLYVKDKYKDEYPLIVFKPVTKVALKEQEARRKQKSSDSTDHDKLRMEALRDVGGDIGLYISDEHWSKIEKVLPAKIKPFVVLCYAVGFRKSESLAADIDDIYEDHYHAHRQLEKYNPFNWKTGTKSLKDYETRKIPFWFTSADEVYALVSSIKERMHPDTLGKMFADLMLKLELPYEMHDLRRTFITRALRTQAPTDVQDAAGHSDLKTTMQYKMEDRKFSAKKFKPNRGLATVKR